MLNGGGAELSCGNGAQEGAHVCSALGSERRLELVSTLVVEFGVEPQRSAAV